MGKRKPFINKKTAHSFVLMHRSQQDPLYHQEDGSKLVLHPANKATAKALKSMGMQNMIAASLQEQMEDMSLDNKAESVASSQANGELREVDEMGLPVDGYNYSKHFAALSGEGTFISKSGQVMSSSAVKLPNGPSTTKASVETENLEEDSDDELMKDSKSLKPFSLPSELLASKKEYGRMLEAITLRADRMDDDMKYLLEVSSDVDEEEVPEEFQDCVGTLDDNFMSTLMEAEENAPDEGGFDYDAHVARLMEEAEKEDRAMFGDEEDEEFEEIDEADEILDQVTDMRKQRDIDIHFEKLLEAEYGDEEIGELDYVEFDDRTGGVLDTESTAVKQALDEFVEERKSRKARAKEIGATSSNAFIRASAMMDQIRKEDEEDTESIPSELDPDEVNTHFGYIPRVVEKWDCETIVSTYSVLDNHPTLITATKTGKKKNRKPVAEASIAEDGPNNFDDDFQESGSIMPPVNTAIGRDKKETAEEKRMRKALVKEQQRMRRAEKKSTKLLYKEEHIRQQKHANSLRAAAAPPDGASTFKF